MTHAFARVLPDVMESHRAVCPCGVVRRVCFGERGYVTEYKRDGAWQTETMACTRPAGQNGATT